MRLLLVLLLGFAYPTLAEELDRHSQEGLSKTQDLLKSRTEREKFIGGDANAKRADQKVKDLTSSPEQQDAVYNVSSDIFTDVVQKTNGDEKLQKEMLDKAMKDPEGFFNSLSPAQQDQIRQISGQIEKRSPPGSPRH